MHASGKMTLVVQRMRAIATVKRDAPSAYAQREQATDGELGTEWASSDQPTSAGSTTDASGAGCGCGAGDTPTCLQTGIGRAP
jgi:hypothetical protein